MKTKWQALAGVALLFAGLGAYVSLWVAPRPAPADPVATLFAGQLPDAQGTPQAMGQWKGKTLLINFWATWCAPCVEEMPELSGLQGEIAGRNAQIIGIGIDSPANIAQFTAKYKISYPLYVAGLNGAEVSRAFGNELGGLPFSVLVSPDGAIKKTYLGRLNLAQVRRDLAGIP